MIDQQQAVDNIGQLDHDRANEYLVFGPPGCGKSTNLSRQIARASAKFGERAVLCTSFSRAAAAELVSRDLPIPRDLIGTLHSHCFRALANPQIAEANVGEWNQTNASLAITQHRSTGRLDGEESAEDADDGAGGRSGDFWLGELNRYRAKLIPREAWPLQLIQFEQKWTEYKQSLDLLDFTDLIETALRDVRIAPGNPAVIFADEAQDFTKLEFQLVRQWGKNAEYFVAAGDDDQTIFSFSGASPDAMLDNDLPEDHKIILSQSYRVPRAVQASAERLIRSVTRRQEKKYNPRDEEGHVGRLPGGTWRAPDVAVQHAVDQLAAGKSVMFLASCSYLLSPLLKCLRDRGIPFHNQYRVSNGAWNPLRRDSRGSAINRVMSLLAPHPEAGAVKAAWSFGDVALWAEWLEAKTIMHRGAKKRLTDADHTRPVYMQDLAELFQDAALDELVAAFEGNSAELLRWWKDHLAASFRPRAEFATEIARRHGLDALCAEPRVTVGTIHSVKGGQADVVYLWPDLSRAGAVEYERQGTPRDSVVRLFYVGMTRAREALYWCPQASPMAINL